MWLEGLGAEKGLAVILQGIKFPLSRGLESGVRAQTRGFLSSAHLPSLPSPPGLVPWLVTLPDAVHAAPPPGSLPDLTAEASRAAPKGTPDVLVL